MPGKLSCFIFSFSLEEHFFGLKYTRIFDSVISYTTNDSLQIIKSMLQMDFIFVFLSNQFRFWYHNSLKSLLFNKVLLFLYSFIKKNNGKSALLDLSHISIKPKINSKNFISKWRIELKIFVFIETQQRFCALEWIFEIFYGE